MNSEQADTRGMHDRAPVYATAVAAALMATFFAVDGVAQQAVYHCLSGASAAVVLLGIKRHRPARRTPWVLLASGLLVMTAADIYGDLLRADLAIPELVGLVLYLTAWLLLIQAIRGFARARVPGGDRDAVLDAVAVVIAVALVLWGVLLDPALREQGLGVVQSTSIAAFPLAQAGLLALYLRLLFAGGAQLWSAWLLCLGGGVGGLLGSTAYVVLTATGGYQPGAWNNIFWMIAYAAPGVAALCPDMTELTRPVHLRSAPSTPRWLVLSAALIATTATASFSATHVGNLQLFAVAIPVPLVVLWRLRRVLVDKDAAVARAEQEAARHALVAAIGEQAIAGDTGAGLVADACARLEAVFGVPVHVVSASEPLLPAETELARCLMVPLTPDRVQRTWLQLDAVDGKAWTASDLALAHSIANILTAASARHEYHERIRWSADHDSLTGVANRRRLMARLEEELSDVSASPVGLIFLDLNRFKEINDTMGHAAGDAVLVEVARRLERGVRRHDLVARLAGDEFVILCSASRAGDAVDLPQLASRVQLVLHQPMQHAGKILHISASFGVALHQPGQGADDLLRSADALMYEDKASAHAIHARS